MVGLNLKKFLFLLVLCGVSLKAQFPKERLDGMLASQDYGPVLNYLYYDVKAEDLQTAQLWAVDNAEKGHVPLMYWIIRGLANSGFAGNHTVVLLEAFKWALRGMIQTNMDIACCNHVGQEFPVTDILVNKRNERFDGRITQEVYGRALAEVKKIIEDKKGAKNSDDEEVYPNPVWTACCERGGRNRPALSCRIPSDDDRELFENDVERRQALRLKGYEQAIEACEEELGSFPKVVEVRSGWFDVDGWTNWMRRKE